MLPVALIRPPVNTLPALKLPVTLDDPVLITLAAVILPLELIPTLVDQTLAVLAYVQLTNGLPVGPTFNPAPLILEYVD